MDRSTWMMTRLGKLVRDDFRPPEGLKMVVAGMPRGGTTFTATVLGQVVETGHESIFGNVRLNNPPFGRTPEIEVSGFAAPWTEILKKRGIPVVQLLRNPLHTCTSFFNYFSAGKERKFKATWEEACATYYIFHRWIESVADLSVKVEDWKREFPIALRLIGITDVKGLHDPKITSARWSEPRNRWEDMPRELQAFGARMGYSE